MIIGNYTMLNLFIAILLGNFEAGVNQPEGKRSISAIRTLVLKYRARISWPFTKLFRNPRPRQPTVRDFGGAASCTPTKQRSLNAKETAWTDEERDAIAHEVLTTWAELAAEPPIYREDRRQFFDDEELSAVFASIDTSGDGNIDAGELKAAIRKVNPKVDDHTVARMLTFLDDDGDAEVNFDEFKKIIISGTAVEVRIPNPKPDPNPNPNHVPNPNPNR